MSQSYWIAAIALGLILLSASGQAQEKAQSEQGQAQAEQQPAQTLPIPLPVDVIEDEATAEARKRSEAEARQREIDDLIAQQGMNTATKAMNDATQRMARYSLVSTILVGIGTFLLIVTLGLTRQANRAAQAAVDVTRDMGQAQVRAYVLWNGANIGETRDNFGKRTGFAFIPTIRNTGQSPARLTNLYSYLFTAKPDERPVVDFDIAACAVSDELGAGAPFEMADQWLGMPEALETFRGQCKVFLLGWGSYRSVFYAPDEPDHTFKFCFEIKFKASPEIIPAEHMRANISLHSQPDYHIAPIVSRDKGS